MKRDPFHLSVVMRGQSQDSLLWVAVALIVIFFMLCRAFMQDWRWIFGFPVHFAAVYLFIKFWAWAGGIDRDGLTPEDRAQRDREGDGWQ